MLEILSAGEEKKIGGKRVDLVRKIF